MAAVARGRRAVLFPWGRRWDDRVVSRRVSSPEFVGRGPELEAMLEAVERAASSSRCSSRVSLASGRAGSWVGSRALQRSVVRGCSEATA